MLFEDASDDNDENASYVEDKDEVDEREYDLAHILHPPFRCKCLLSSLQRLLPQHYPFQSCSLLDISFLMKNLLLTSPEEQCTSEIIILVFALFSTAINCALKKG